MCSITLPQESTHKMHRGETKGDVNMHSSKGLLFQCWSIKKAILLLSHPVLHLLWIAWASDHSILPGTNTNTHVFFLRQPKMLLLK